MVYDLNGTTLSTGGGSGMLNVLDYGFKADGTTDNTGKLQAALSTCPKGGTVYVPAGRYRTSSLFMKSCTTLYLEKGAVLLGDNDRTHYPILPGVGVGVLGAEQGVVIGKGDGVQPGAGGDGCQPLDGHSTVRAGGMDMQVTGHSGLLP